MVFPDWKAGGTPGLVCPEALGFLFAWQFSLTHPFQLEGYNNLYPQGYKQNKTKKSEKNLYYRLLLKIKYLKLCA